jgi:DNA-binding GntR family transcriptional regulator
MRLVIELAAARKAALFVKKNSRETLGRLNNQHIVAKQENDEDKLLSVKRKFHLTIY